MPKVFFCSLAMISGIIFCGCNTTPVQDGALLGGALGAGLGAVAGHQSGHQGEGALIGATAGALTGALIGDQVAQSPAPAAYAPAPVRYSAPARPVRSGHYETRLVHTPSGECYEQRVWIPHY